MHDTENEIWKSIPGFACYEVSSSGRVRSVPRTVYRIVRGKTIAQPRKCAVLKLHLDKYGYYQVGIYANGVRKRTTVHRFVALAFLGPCPAGMEICHNNGIATDNRLENLRYGSHPENIFDSHYIHGRRS